MLLAKMISELFVVENGLVREEQGLLLHFLLVHAQAVDPGGT